MGLEQDRNVKTNKHYQRLYNKYTLLALNIFKWENLPNNLEGRHIEKALFLNGQATFYKDKDLGFICLPSSDGGRPNIYGESKNAIVTSYGKGFSKNVEIINCLDEYQNIDNDNVISGIRIINNDLMIPSQSYVADYSNKMYEVETAINLNVAQQKFPYFIETNTKTEYTLKAMFNKVQKGEVAIFANKNISLDDLRVFDLKVPYVVDRLNSYKYELEREILTFFGLNNTYEKKERLLVDEINSNNDYISRNVEIMYKCRKKACELINEVYGLNIEVKKVDLFHNVDDTEQTMINNLRKPQGGEVTNVYSQR